MSEADRWIDMQEAREILGNEYQVYKNTRDGRIKWIRTGKSKMYSKEDCEKCVKIRKAGGNYMKKGIFGPYAAERDCGRSLWPIMRRIILNNRGIHDKFI